MLKKPRMRAHRVQRFANGQSLIDRSTANRADILKDKLQLDRRENDFLARDLAEFQKIASQGLHPTGRPRDSPHKTLSVEGQSLFVFLEQKAAVTRHRAGGRAQVVGDGIREGLQLRNGFL